MAGEEAAGLWVQKFWPAVVPSHLLVCWVPCWVTKGMVPRTSVPEGALPLLSTKVSLFFRSTSKDNKQRVLDIPLGSGVRSLS